MKKNLLPLTIPTLILTGCLSFIAPALHAAGNTTTWTGGGGDDNWGTTSNWSGGTTPSALGDDFINFAGSTRLTPFNNYGTFTQYQSILFSSGAGAFNLNGNNIKFYGKIENNSSALETISFASIVAVGGSGAAANQFNPISGNLTINNAVILDNNSLLNVYGNNSKILTFNGVISNGASSTGSVKVNENSTVVYKGANTYTGNTEINTGTIRVDANPGNATSNYFVGNGNTPTTAATLLLGGANGTGGGVTLNNAIQANPGASGNRVIGGSNTTGTNTFGGTLTLTDSNATLLAATGGIVAFNTITGAALRTVAVGTSGNTGTVRFGGTADNLNIAATVNFGTLELAKTSSATVHALGSLLTVNTGATAKITGTGGDQIFNTAGLTLAGGTFDLNGISEGAAGITGIGALTLSANSTISFGLNTNQNNIVQFSELGARTPSTVLAITNWNGIAGTGGSQERLLFSGTASSFTFNQSEVSFNGVSGYNAIQFSGFYEITAVPEPSTWLGGGLIFGLAAWSQRKRLASLTRSNAQTAA